MVMCLEMFSISFNLTFNMYDDKKCNVHIIKKLNEL